MCLVGQHHIASQWIPVEDFRRTVNDRTVRNEAVHAPQCASDFTLVGQQPGGIEQRIEAENDRCKPPVALGLPVCRGQEDR